LSKYLECNTVLGDRKFLVAALAELGYHAEVHPDGAALFGYEGRERPERAHVIIRRKELSPASNDIGFARSPDGRFVALLSEYDQQIGYDRQWLGKVQQIYKEKQTIATARAKGLRVSGPRGGADRQRAADPAAVQCQVGGRYASQNHHSRDRRKRE